MKAINTKNNTKRKKMWKYEKEKEIENETVNIACLSWMCKSAGIGYILENPFECCYIFNVFILCAVCVYIYFLTSTNDKINRNGVKINISNAALKFVLLRFAHSFARSFVAFAFALVLLLFCYCCCWFCCILFVSFESHFSVELMKNLLRSFIHFIMNNSYEIKHLAYHSVCRRLQSIYTYSILHYNRQTTHHHSLASPLYLYGCLCLLVCWLIWLDAGGSVTTKMHFLNVIETLLTDWQIRFSLKLLFGLMITYIKFTVSCVCVLQMLFILCYPIMIWGSYILTHTSTLTHEKKARKYSKRPNTSKSSYFRWIYELINT